MKQAGSTIAKGAVGVSNPIPHVMPPHVTLPVAGLAGSHHGMPPHSNPVPVADTTIDIGPAPRALPVTGATVIGDSGDREYKQSYNAGNAQAIGTGIIIGAGIVGGTVALVDRAVDRFANHPATRENAVIAGKTIANDPKTKQNISDGMKDTADHILP